MGITHIKRIGCMLTLTAYAACMLTAQTMRDVLKEMPDSILPMFTKNDRLDFIDFIDNNMKATVRTRFGDTAEMTVLADDFCHIHTAETSHIEMKLLNGGDILCVVNSVKNDGWDSSVRFFSRKWERMDGKGMIAMPDVRSFIPKTDGMHDSEYRNLLNRADLPYYHITMNADNTDIKVTYSSAAANDRDYDTLIKPYIHPDVTMHWNGSSFEH